MTLQFNKFITENRDSLKMALSHGLFEEAMKIVYEAGYLHGAGDLSTVRIELLDQEGD